MAAKHRMDQPPEQRGVRGSLSGIAAVCEAVSASMLCAATVALLASVEPENPSVVADQLPAPTSQPVSQEGTVIAVSAGSVTARSANGYTQTYLVTPNTAVITKGGAQTGTARSYFAVNDHVDIVGTIRGGTALATAVADRGAGHGGGPPMDSVEDQPLTGAADHA